MSDETGHHTPGPWRVAGRTDEGLRTDWSLDDVMTESEPSIRICNVYGGLSWPKGNANANLIAAAPDLLAACEAYLDAMERYGHPDKTDRMMVAAIAKARGAR